MGAIPRVGTIARPDPERTSPMRRLLVMLSQWRERAVQRRQLAQLVQDPHLLRDVGLSVEAAGREAGKGFWRP